MHAVGGEQVQVIHVTHTSGSIDLLILQLIHQVTDAYQVRPCIGSHVLQGHDDETLRQQGWLFQQIHSAEKACSIVIQ